MRKIFISSDHAGFTLKEKIINHFRKKELNFFEATRSSALRKFNFFKYLDWIFEPCDEKKCLKLKEDNYSFDKIIKGTSMLVETSYDQQSFSLKLFLE